MIDYEQFEPEGYFDVMLRHVIPFMGAVILAVLIYKELGLYLGIFPLQ